jgi:hypothetical protein
MADTTYPTPEVPVPSVRRPAIPTTWAGAVREGVVGTFAVVLSGARLWLRHWPVLISLALLGGAGRMGAIWGATVVSDANNTLGVLVLVLAPLASVTAIVLMLYALRHSLPHIRSVAERHGPDAVTTGRERRLLDVLASVLVPFLAVYASYGLLKEDTDRYVNAAVADEFLANADIFYNPGNGIDTDRFVFATGWLAFAIVAGAIVLRWGLARLEGARGWLWLGFAGAYVEVLWLTTLAAHLTVYKDQAWDWVESRKGVDMFAGWWLDLMDRIGPFSNPVDAATDWLFGVLGQFDAIVVIPVSWLAVGAVVYGHKLVPPPAPEPRQRKVFAAVPKPVRRWGAEVVADVRERFTGLTGGLRQLAIAGLAPMLIFGLAFLASARLEDLMNLAGRYLMGPQELDTWLAFAPHVETVTRALGLTVTMCLLAAAVDRVLARGGGVPDVETTGPDGAPAGQGAATANEA